MDLIFRENYWDDPAAKRQFLDYLNRMFNLDLTLWDNLGYWDYRYRPFSFFDGGKLVASLCVYSMDMTVQGKRREVAQISAVGTIPEYRRRGLNAELTKRALAWGGPRHDFFFLFADEEAFPFYRKCGFRRADEHSCRYAITGQAAIAGAVKLNVADKADLELMHSHTVGRAPVSELLGVHNDKLFIFWCLYFLRENIYLIKDLDALVLYSRKDGVLTIYDVVARQMPTFEDIYPHISAAGDRFVEFQFMPDRMNMRAAVDYRLQNNGTHLNGKFPPIGGKFIFPCTSRA